MPTTESATALTARASLLLVVAALALFPIGAAAQDRDFSAVEIRALPVSGNVSMLMGEGGNIGVSVGDDGTLMVDDQYAPLTPKLLAAVSELGGGPVRLVVNTHWHGDHTGGNENLGRAGALLIGHDAVRERMSAEQFVAAFGRRTPPSPEEALPVLTFSETLTVHWNGDAIRAVHVANAHTDGDSLIHFAKADVVHMGDTFFNGMYPFVDVSTGGTLDGMVAAAERGLELAGPETRIIPGHGPLAQRADLEAYRDMLVAVREKLRDAARRGLDVEAVVASKPTREFDAAFGTGFLEPDAFVRIVYSSVAP